MYDSRIPRLSSLIARLRSEDAPATDQSDGDDQAVLVLDSTAIIEPAPLGSTDRRAFLARASLLSLAIPGVGAALTAGVPLDAPIRVKVGDRVRFRVLSTDGTKDFDLECDRPGAFPFVNHAYGRRGSGHRQKGAIGFLVVEP